MLKIVEKTCIECNQAFLTHRKYKECPECAPHKYRSKKYDNRKTNQKALDRKAAKAITKVIRSISLTSAALQAMDVTKLAKMVNRIDGDKVVYVGNHSER